MSCLQDGKAIGSNACPCRFPCIDRDHKKTAAIFAPQGEKKAEPRLDRRAKALTTEGTEESP